MTKESKAKGHGTIKLALAAIAAVGSLSLAIYQFRSTRPFSSTGPARSTSQFRQVQRKPTFIKTDDGRELLWARGPRDIETGEWFDVTDSPLKPAGYQFGIGKDSIPAIDHPAFVAIDERETLLVHGISDKTDVIGYVHNGEAKAYPIVIMDRHELVNDMVGGKPVTVGW